MSAIYSFLVNYMREPAWRHLASVDSCFGIGRCKKERVRRDRQYDETTGISEWYTAWIDHPWHCKKWSVAHQYIVPVKPTYPPIHSDDGGDLFWIRREFHCYHERPVSFEFRASALNYLAYGGLQVRRPSRSVLCFFKALSSFERTHLV